MALRGSSRNKEAPSMTTPTVYRRIAYSFVALTIIIVFAALWFSSVRATVLVSVTREPTPIEVHADLARAPEQGMIAGRVVQGVFELIKEYEVTEGDGKAIEGTSEGTVRIMNDRSTAQPLVATTRLLTSDDRLYRIKDAVNVPAGGSVTVEAYADEDGAEFDFSETTPFTIPGLSESLQEVVYAESVTAFTGGELFVRAVRQEDVDAARADLELAVLDQAKSTLASEVGDSRFTESVYLVRTVEQKSSEDVGDEADHFLLSLKLDVTGVFYNKKDMDALVRDKIKDRVPEGREIAMADPVRVDVSVDSVHAAEESASLTANAEVLTKITDISELLSKEAITGLPVEDARRELEDMEGIDSVEIQVRPGWVRRLPTLRDHITMKIE